MKFLWSVPPPRLWWLSSAAFVRDHNGNFLIIPYDGSVSMARATLNQTVYLQNFFLYISSMGWKIKVWEPTCAPVATRKMEKKFNLWDNLWDNSWIKEACLLCLLTEFRSLSLGTVLKGKVGQKRSLFMKGDWSPMHARTISARAYCRVYVSLTDFVGHTTTSRQLGQPVSFSYNACYFLRVNFFCMYSS